MIVSPLYGKNIDEPLDVTLTMVIVPLFVKVTPVDVHPLRYIAPVAMMAHDELFPMTVAVLNSIVLDSGPPSPRTL